MATYLQIEKELYEDTKIDSLNLGEEALRCSRLHSKWLRYFNEFRVKYNEQNRLVLEMEGLRSRYYEDELTREELEERGWVEWNKGNKRKTNAAKALLLETDPVLLPMRDKLFRTKLCADTCEEALKEIKQRGFNIKTSVEWAKFQAGS